MNRISLVFAASAVFCLNMNASGQAPGGVSTGLTAWYHAEAGTTVTPRGDKAGVKRGLEMVYSIRDCGSTYRPK